MVSKITDKPTKFAVNENLEISFSRPKGFTGVTGYHTYKPLILNAYNNSELEFALQKNSNLSNGIFDNNKLDKVLNNYLVQGCPLAALKKIKLILDNLAISSHKDIELVTALLFQLINSNNETAIENDSGIKTDALDLFLEHMHSIQGIVPHETQLIIDTIFNQLTSSIFSYGSKKQYSSNKSKHANILAHFYFIRTNVSNDNLAIKTRLADYFVGSSFKGIDDSSLQKNIKQFAKNQEDYDFYMNKSANDNWTIKFAQKMQKENYPYLSQSQKSSIENYLKTQSSKNFESDFTKVEQKFNQANVSLQDISKACQDYAENIEQYELLNQNNHTFINAKRLKLASVLFDKKEQLLIIDSNNWEHPLHQTASTKKIYEQLISYPFNSNDKNYYKVAVCLFHLHMDRLNGYEMDNPSISSDLQELYERYLETKPSKLEDELNLYGTEKFSQFEELDINTDLPQKLELAKQIIENPQGLLKNYHRNIEAFINTQNQYDECIKSKNSSFAAYLQNSCSEHLSKVQISELEKISGESKTRTKDSTSNSHNIRVDVNLFMQELNNSNTEIVDKFEMLDKKLPDVNTDISDGKSKITKENIADIANYVSDNSNKITDKTKLHRIYNIVIQIIQSFINNELKKPKADLTNELRRIESKISDLGLRQKAIKKAQEKYDIHLIPYTKLNSIKRDFRKKSISFNQSATNIV